MIADIYTGFQSERIKEHIGIIFKQDRISNFCDFFLIKDFMVIYSIVDIYF